MNTAKKSTLLALVGIALLTLSVEAAKADDANKYLVIEWQEKGLGRIHRAMK